MKDIKYVNINELKPYDQNSRTHSETQIEQIVNSINTFGWTNPILIDENNLILAGHGRLRAAHEIGMDKVPCIELNKLSDVEKKAYVLADNKLAENSGWDNNLLKTELNELKNLDFNLDVIGFDSVELSTILDEIDLEESDWSDNESIIQYNIIFDNEKQQDIWFQFIKFLKTTYEEKDTIGERLIAHIENPTFSVKEDNG